MHSEKMLRVIGLSSAVLFDKNDPYNPFNRRISIIIMNKKAEESINLENQSMEIQHSDEIDSAVIEQNMPLQQ